ncbi:MAG: LytTR family DNA-binding domain-containing protein [Bacteroidia bacterium]|nr:LytTR family DNA-binding domain-containing protein [Bacteroidia bacterium]
MLNPFRQPYKEVATIKNRVISILIFGLFIFLFLFLFKPFGMAQLESIHQFLLSIGFGFITTFILLIYNFLIARVIKDRNWTLGKNILWDLFIAASIGAANYVFISAVFNIGFVFKYFLFSVWTGILVGSIPITISYFIVYNKMYRNALREASIPEENITWEEEVVITAGNTKNDFRVNPRHIIYMCSNDNYVTIVTNKNNITNKTTIRGTLKSAEYELRKNNRFIRCHKCYLVNLDFVDKVTGPNQNMKISLSVADMEIPVARSRAEEVSRRVEKTVHPIK